MVTLRAIDRGELPAAPLLIVEANTLAFELDGRGKEIGAAIDSPWFRLGMTVPNLGATARPTAFGYSLMLAATSDGTMTMGDGSGLSIPSKPRILTGSVPDLDLPSAALVAEISAIFHRLQERGSDILLVMLPPGAPENSAQSRIARAVAVESGVRWWDLTDGLPDGAVGYSDGLHLDSPSAQKVLRTLIPE